jgi:hypothetical protein
MITFTIIMYIQGGVYRSSKHSPCTWTKKSKVGFCDLQVLQLACPPSIKSHILDTIQYKNVGKYVIIPKWKGGRTLSTQDCITYLPDLVHFYHSLTPLVSSIVGSLVTTTPLYLPTSCAVLVYEKENDYINWHYDVNYFLGRFFTLLIPVTENTTCTKFIYKDSAKQDISIDLRGDTSVLFEGEHVFHMASKLCKNERRVLISLQFTTNDDRTLFSKILTRFKDIAFIGAGSY